MIRAALLLAVSSVNGSCSPAAPTGNATAAADGNAAAAGLKGRAQSRDPGPEAGPTIAQERILISSEWGQVTAQLVDNEATRTLVRMLPLTIKMRDHLRQEKTGTLPSALPDLQRQVEFSAGTLGLWGDADFVIYYRNGRVPSPGIIILGRATGDLSILDNPDPVTIRLQRSD